MSELIAATPGVYFGSALYNKELMTHDLIRTGWIKRFGPSAEFHHDFFPMKEYYSKQMGAEHLLSRVLFISLNLEKREAMVGHKLWADQWEKSLMSQSQFRPLNLDIGLLTLENMTLATGKNFSHRIYLGEGVYSDLNLVFESKSFKTLPWTYPDYAHPDFINFFNWVRGMLLRKYNEKRS
jgi:hypothetical protein